jgi:post-segregation antitoxin (ccd killing protein)
VGFATGVCVASAGTNIGRTVAGLDAPSAGRAGLGQLRESCPQSLIELFKTTATDIDVEPMRIHSARMKRGLREADELTREAERERWRAENREAIENYNARIARDGIFGERYPIVDRALR